jgi:GrpB-like predicted nucleotidyltransferase (UPF0157 family)
LAEKEWSDVEGYADAKTAVIEEILARTDQKSDMSLTGHL